MISTLICVRRAAEKSPRYRVDLGPVQGIGIRARCARKQRHAAAEPPAGPEVDGVAKIALKHEPGGPGRAMGWPANLEPERSRGQSAGVQLPFQPAGNDALDTQVHVT